MTFNSILRNIESEKWVFAKTMPENPHWYTLRKNWLKDEDFVYFVQYIRDHGYTIMFEGNKYTCFNINGFKYWTMGAPINKKDGTPYTILINRARVTYHTEYDKIALEYDLLFNDSKHKKEDIEVINLARPSGKILDVGCGSGLLIDRSKYFELNRIDMYTGIDISRNMINVFVSKHPEFMDRLHVTSLEDFYSYDKFDTIIGLYGVGSYLRKEDLSKIIQMLATEGRAFIMFYGNDYYPITYKKLGIEENINRDIPDLPGELVKYHNYLIWKYGY